MASPADLAAPAADLAGADLATPTDLMHPADLHELPDLRTTPVVQIGAVTTGTSTLTASLPHASRAGTTLILSVVFDGGGNGCIAHDLGGGCESTGPTAGGTWYRDSGYSPTIDGELWYLTNNPGGITTVSTTFAVAQHSVGQLSEWSFGAEDTIGWCWSSASSATLSCPTTAQSTNPGTTTLHDKDVGLAVVGQLLGSAQTVTMSTSTSGWSNLGNNDSSSTTLHYAFNWIESVPLGSTFTDGETSNASGQWGGAIVMFQP